MLLCLYMNTAEFYKCSQNTTIIFVIHESYDGSQFSNYSFEQFKKFA
jgi:hypothetical protein